MSIDVAAGDYPSQPSPFRGITDAELAEIIARVVLPRLTQNLGCKTGSALSPDERERQLHYCLAGIAALKEPKESPIRVAFVAGLESYFRRKFMQFFEDFFRAAFQKRYGEAVWVLTSFILNREESEDSLAKLLLEIRAEANAAIIAETSRWVDIGLA